MKLRRYQGGTGGVGYGSTIAFWAWEAVVRVGRVLESCTGADNESLVVWRGYQQKLPELNLVEVHIVLVSIIRSCVATVWSQFAIKGGC